MATMPSRAFSAGAFSFTGRHRESTNRARSVRPSCATITTSALPRSDGFTIAASNQSHRSKLAVMPRFRLTRP
jgi:hypothetical protein